MTVSVLDRGAWASGYTDVTVQQAKEMIDSNPLLVVLDVRNRTEYDSGHIRNARLMPHDQLASRLDELDKNRVILVYCRTGVRSADASQTLADNNFTKVYNMLGGITAWINAGFPVYVRYSSLQDAIDDANTGDTIRVSVGNYTQSKTLIINKPVTLEGENKTTTTISSNFTVYRTISIEANNIIIRDFTMRNNWYVIYCDESSYANLTVQDNIMRDNRIAGITLYGSRHLVCINTIVNSGFGILIGSIGYNTITQNTLIGNPSTGIELRDAKNNRVTKNYIANGFVGIRFYSNSDNNTINENTLVNCINGISIHESSWNCITRNSVKNNTGVGVSFVQSYNNTLAKNRVFNGVKGLFLSFSNNNNIYHNNIINNSLQLENRNSTNNWDNGFLEGNYWSDYNGTDTDGDGVGDTFLHWQRVDNYPLINPYLDGDANHDGIVEWLDVDLVQNAWQILNNAVNYNPHTDFNMDGIINIKDATMIGVNWLREWQD